MKEQIYIYSWVNPIHVELKTIPLGYITKAWLKDVKVFSGFNRAIYMEIFDAFDFNTTTDAVQQYVPIFGTPLVPIRKNGHIIHGVTRGFENSIVINVANGTLRPNFTIILYNDFDLLGTFPPLSWFLVSFHLKTKPYGPEKFIANKQPYWGLLDLRCMTNPQTFSLQNIPYGYCVNAILNYVCVDKDAKVTPEHYTVDFGGLIEREDTIDCGIDYTTTNTPVIKDFQWYELHKIPVTFTAYKITPNFTITAYNMSGSIIPVGRFFLFSFYFLILPYK